MILNFKTWKFTYSSSLKFMKMVMIINFLQSIMVSPIYSKYLYADESRVKGVCDVNTSAVDLEKFPDVMKIKYWVANANEGDCIYIPQMWWHQVYSR